VLSHVEFEGDRAKVYNVRNCNYITETDYQVRHYDKSLDLNDLTSVDFIVVPFIETETLAHTMLSFGFADGYQLVVSAEVRLEKGETYSALPGNARKYELIYVVADERDIIPLRTEHRDVEVFLYRTTATPQQARTLFVDVMRRVNRLYHEPEFYNILTNNCTTNIVGHINRLFPGKVPADYRTVLPGYADELAYELGLIDTDVPLKEARRRAKINAAAARYAGREDFSQSIRR